MIGPIIIALVCVALAFMVRLFVNAPLGYEDSEGFHYGEPPIEDWSDYTGEI